MTPSPDPKTSLAGPVSARGLISRAWPSNSQLAAALLMGVVASLLAVHGYGLTRWGCRPTDLTQLSGPHYRIDLNRADRAELMQLPHVGENLADRIIAYRQEHGDFETLNDLKNVRGIGPATLDHISPWTVADSRQPAPESKPRSETATPRVRTAAPKKGADLAQPIDVNRASLQDLQRLPGIGAKMAQRILDERAKAPFKSIEDLRRVAGIGPKRLERLREVVAVGTAGARLVADERK